MSLEPKTNHGDMVARIMAAQLPIYINKKTRKKKSIRARPGYF